MSRPAVAREQIEVARGRLVVLRLKCPEDAPADYAWARDPELARLNHREVTSQPYSRWLSQFEYDLRVPTPRQRMLAIESAAGIHIGNVMFYNASSAGDAAEFGITIGDRAHRGNGLGREATVLFLRYLWETTALRTISLHALASNEPAIRCFRAAGFEDSGHMQSNGELLARMIVRREWWLLRDAQGRYGSPSAGGARPAGSPENP